MRNFYCVFQRPANVLGQSVQNFDWVLIVDPNLPEHYRRRLEDIRSDRPRIHIHEISADDELGELGWLEPHIPEGTDFVVTTLLDDDDILPLTFSEKLQSHIGSLGAAIPSLKTFFVGTSYEWDFFVSKKHPYGSVAPWHRPGWPRSAGYSLLCDLSKHRVTCFTLAHLFADQWFNQGDEEEVVRKVRINWGRPRMRARWVHKAVSKFQKRLMRSAGPGGGDWKSLSPQDLHYDLSEEGLAVIQTNHFLNLQKTRLIETKPQAGPVEKNQFFPGDIRIDWALLDKNRDLFRISWAWYREFARNIENLAKSRAKSRLGRRLVGLYIFKELTRFFLTH